MIALPSRVALCLLLSVLVSGAVAGEYPASGKGETRLRQAPPPDAIGTGAGGILPPIVEAPADNTFATAAGTSRFLARATFGPRGQDLERLTGGSASRWYQDQLSLPISYASPQVDAYVAAFAAAEEDNSLRFLANTLSFWNLAVSAPDQLRQRMAFALSQILVVSDASGGPLRQFPSGIAYYRDLLAEHALGNYRDLLEAVTRAPAMGYYLTYLGNRPADPRSGRMPDENYAREILQLFTIGLKALGADGTPLLDDAGLPRETYSNADVSGLARVFTGFELDWNRAPRDGDRASALYAAVARPMVLRERLHSRREKTFLNLTIPEGTSAEESLRLALDHIFAHPNLGPFLGRQLIQRFSTSDPSPGYVAEVSAAFDSGRYILPDDTVIGDGRRGDLAATLAAVLFRAETWRALDVTGERFGKLREPVLRVTQWARAFDVDASHPEYRAALFATQSNSALSQHPYRAPSVFNFYRPGYVPPGTLAGRAGMTVPEMQLVNASSTPGYINFMTDFVFATAGEQARLSGIERRLDSLGLPFDRAAARVSFVPDYGGELPLADDPQALLMHLDLLVAHGDLADSTRAAISELIAAIPLTPRAPDGRRLRVQLAVLMTLTSPDYLVQR